MTAATETQEQRIYRDNLELSRLEYQARRLFLWSRPRCLGVVLGNSCNIKCVHCYQAKNGDHLLRPPEIGRELRREFTGLYPYLSTLDLLGGEVLALKGFTDLIEDLRSTISRPILSITTNGTLLDDRWAELIVRTPFQSVTVSIDGATPATMAKLRVGADLEVVLAGLRRILAWKRRLSSELPVLGAFFVIMRSNFREIPAFLELMRANGVVDVALQTVEINHENMRRNPWLERAESIKSPQEVRELYTILSDALARERPLFRAIRVCGLSGLFAAHGLPTDFLCEQIQGLYPSSVDFAGEKGFECCPNPWTTLFIAESGNAHLCFLSEPIGNLYESPLDAIWNSPRAVAKRSQVIAGRYSESGCSKQWCGWRDAHPASPRERFQESLAAMTELSRQARLRSAPSDDNPSVAAVRRAFQERDRRIAEMESLFAELCRANGEVHSQGQQYINELENEVTALKANLHELQARHRPFLEKAAVRLGRSAGRAVRALARS